MMDALMICCGLASLPGEGDHYEDYHFVGIARPQETPYDFSSRLLATGKYASVTTVPLWRLPQFPLAWRQFLERNQCEEKR